MFLRLFFIFAFLLIAPAAFASTVSIDMPASGDAQSTAYVYAYYYNNSVFVPGASCTLSGGFLQNPVSFTYNAGGYYIYSLYLASAGSYTFTVSCSKAGYPDASNSAPISVSKLPSTMSLDSSPPYSANVGDKVRFRAYYSSGTKIPGASCNLKATTPSGSQENVGMGEASDHYYADYSLSSVGQYTFSAECSSSNYVSVSVTNTLQSAKRSATVTRQSIPAYYYNDPVNIYYRYESGGYLVPDADCRYEFRKGSLAISSGRMSYSSKGYLFSAAAPDADQTPYALKVSCDSEKYGSVQVEDKIYIQEVPAYLELVSSTPKGAYSFTPVNISARYADSRTGAIIPGADCTIDFLDKSVPSNFLSTYFPAAPKTISEGAEACCSKKNYAKRCEKQAFVISPQPVLADILNLSKILIVGENYSVSVRAAPAYYGDEGALTCALDISDFKGGNQKKVFLERLGAEHTGSVSFEKPGRYRVEIYCAGYGFAESRQLLEAQAKMFTPAVESTLTTTLGVLGLILVAAIILISKKYKI